MTSMEENQDLIERLRNIFSLCDEDNDGYIAADHFGKLAQEHFGAAGSQEITGIINLLDPEGRGLISFDNFCDGIKQILDIQNQVQIQESPFKKDIREISYIKNINGDSSNGDSALTYTEYDLPSSEDISDKGVLTNGDVSSIGQIQHGFLHPQNSEDEGDSAISGKSSEISRHEVTDEENYEDFGEIESEADVSDQGHLTPVSLRKRDHLARPHKRTCLNRRLLTSAAYASQLQRGAKDSPNSTRRSSFGSDGLYDHIDENFDDLNGRVKSLESQLTRLMDHQTKTDSKHTNLKKENGHLTEKVHYMEEQLRYMEMKSDDILKQERKKLQETVASQIREKTDHIDYVTQRLQKLEMENEQLKEEAPRLRDEIHRLRSEKQQYEELNDCLNDDLKKLKAEQQLQLADFKKERESTDKLLDELGTELHDLRRLKIEFECHRGGVTDYGAHYSDLEMEILRLKESYMEEWNDLFQENRNLHESNEELNAQLLTRCMEEGRSLLRETHELSLAEELEHLTKEELLERLKKEQDCNCRLKQYVDKILLTIIDKNPSLLEITNK